ncbi:NADH-ubiquinone oxidoreductase chain 6 [Golovinomyces cichoracearum]|uniref:NADH-ubiquinone oxidoreductase chain 6 n=1 Tax=Golovinomyces cichoracearum TaxID=62708 RepID=A0A420IAP2_9PEZI|nr:NADH-ubiquinone oxidoreductase chain 6 [Golovinomyces cichoracearum]
MGGTFFIFIILYQINETYLNGYIIDSLDFLALSSVLSSIFVIILQNPISSVLFLITLFISIAGISYLLVYVGAVSILFLFILMLINVRISELLSNTNKSIPLAIFIIISFIYTFYPMIPDNYISLLEKLACIGATDPSQYLEGSLGGLGSSPAFEGSFFQSQESSAQAQGMRWPTAMSKPFLSSLERGSKGGGWPAALQEIMFCMLQENHETDVYQKYMIDNYFNYSVIGYGRFYSDNFKERLVIINRKDISIILLLAMAGSIVITDRKIKLGLVS